MTKVHASLLGFMFVAAGAVVIIVGLKFLRGWPAGTVIGSLVLLAALARWYAIVRHADDRVALRTMRLLSAAVVAMVLVVQPLLEYALSRL